MASSRAAGPDCFPCRSIVSGQSESSVTNLTLQTQPERSGALLASAAFASAAHAPAAVHAQKGCRNPAGSL